MMWPKTSVENRRETSVRDRYGIGVETELEINDPPDDCLLVRRHGLGNSLNLVVAGGQPRSNTPTNRLAPLE
jgi:hypothetical protein